MHTAKAASQQGETEQIGHGDPVPLHGSGEGEGEMSRGAKWIGNASESRFMADQRARVERSKVERRDVNLSVHFGVGAQEYLEPPVEQEPVHVVGAHPATNTIGCFEKSNLNARCAKHARAGQTCEARTDDDNPSFR